MPQPRDALQQAAASGGAYSRLNAGILGSVFPSRSSAPSGLSFSNVPGALSFRISFAARRQGWRLQVPISFQQAEPLLPQDSRLQAGSWWPRVPTGSLVPEQEVPGPVSSSRYPTPSSFPNCPGAQCLLRPQRSQTSPPMFSDQWAAASPRGAEPGHPEEAVPGPGGHGR